MAIPEPQTTADVLLIRPKAFRPNAETAASNAFQRAPGRRVDVVRARAAAEFDGFVAALHAAGVRPLVFDDTAEPEKPDAVFPNNWVSFHADGSVVLYPMAASSRRPERRPDIIESLGSRHGFAIRRVLDLSPLEERGLFLEGTGSLVLDRTGRFAYAARSPRTLPEALRAFARELDYDVVSFATADASGQPIYHTNVVMSLGRRFAVLCTEVMPDAIERRAVSQRLAAGGRRLIEISAAQMRSFAGNVLELATEGGGAVIAMSEAARQSFTTSQLAVLGDGATIVATPLPTIESVGGGSARCMLAEIFLPRRQLPFSQLRKR